MSDEGMANPNGPVDALAETLAADTTTILVPLSLPEGLALAGLLQLALRHPTMASGMPELAEVARRFVDRVALAWPAAGPIVEAGWHAER